MQANALLTQDELDFIRTMQHTFQPAVAESVSHLMVNGGSQIKDLLTRLIAQEQVTLQAQFENQQMSFPLHLVEDEFHALQLQLGAPHIYEDGPMMRPWRLTLDTPVALEDELGLSTGLWVREISFKGVLLEIRDQPEPPSSFDLWFSPANGAPIALHGVLQRRTGQSLAAYNLSESQQSEIERLREYILQAHRQTHPELHPQLSR
ncbi:MULTISPECIES: hypothetical protein [Pseudomonas]|jgi:hypothetical protein|uniref:PilZ domain-containing protein n=1 Tax=Pseudomonas sp. Hg7Tf TaxID=3236988 RepID=A0AB39HY63_9PSED|nr:MULTISPECIES: hypothetical protein [Pseudomonas]KJK06064.1 hypothetical protein UB47_19335 [Pseudomonas sp. 5]MDD1978189.1 hypothetical protein [Pseudomonas putida]MDH2559878.1 hypothetical protein [Pseudomonas sp. Hg5Tf]QYX45654.1 hypothetical protein K3F43_13140 [Pseudomonas sp. S11A 273]